MKKKLPRLLIAGLLACSCGAALASPSDIVPDGSGLYDAVALLAQEHVLAVGAPDATDLLGVAHRLRTREEFAEIIRNIAVEPTDPRGRAALAFARNTLAPELGQKSGAGPRGATVGPTGFVEPELEGRDDQGGNLGSRGYIFGRGRVLGTLGRDGAYTVSVTNIYRQTRDHASFTTRGGGKEGGGSPDILNGVDEAYATALGHGGIRVTAGLLRQRWGSGYSGATLVNDNAPAHPTLEVEIPFRLGEKLGDYRFTQYESTFRNEGRTIYQGGRRLEHPIGDRVTVSLEEAYNSDQFSKPLVLFVPYYTFQAHAYPNNIEPLHFNYMANAGLSVQAAHETRVYGQFLIDDLEAPSGISHKNHVPRKIGYLLGWSQAFPQSGTDAVLEFAHADSTTYSNQQSELAWFSDGLPQGLPSGPNGNEIFIRIGQRIIPRLDGSVEFRDRRRVSDDFPAPNDRSLDLALAYHLSASQSIGLQYADYREDPYTETSTSIPGQFGGASDGQLLRRHIIGIGFLQAF